MALDFIWKIHSIEYVAPAAGPNYGTALDEANPTIGALTQVSMPVNANANLTVESGDQFATSGHIDFTSVDVAFTSFNVKEILDLIPVNGSCFSPTDKGWWNIYIAKWGCDGPLAGAVHRRYEIKKGMVAMTSGQCDHRGDLSLACRIRALYDGTNSVVINDTAIALPNATQIGDVTARWTLHEGAKSLVNANAVASKRNLSIDFGISDSTQGADSDPFDTFGSIDQVLPTVTITGVDPLWFDALGLTINGKVVTHANTIVKFRKRDGAGGFVLDATAEHIEMTAHGPAYFDQLASGSGTEALTTSFRIATLEDGSGNAPLIFNTDVAA